MLTREAPAGGEAFRRRLAVLITCHNRRQQTANCLAALLRQSGLGATELCVFVCDDGSDDGTAGMLRSLGDAVTVLHGDGSLYWSGGMRLVFAHALERDFDFYLWLNDDVLLFPTALASLLDAWTRVAADAGQASIVVGTTVDPANGRPWYGGLKTRRGGRTLNLERVHDSDLQRQCDTFNGNCVLIPRAAARIVGNIDRHFRHAMGDLDYGFRARQAGCSAWVVPGFVGECVRNPAVRPWLDSSKPVTQRWNFLIGPKGLPPRAWWVFSSRYGGALWPLRWAYPYLKFGIDALTGALGRRSPGQRQH